MSINADITGLTGTKADVNSFNSLNVVPETDAGARPENVGGVRVFGENDQGAITGTPDISSPENDIDYRQRVAQDIILDEYVVNVAAQDTSKHLYSFSTMQNAWTIGQLTTNSTNLTTTGIGSVVATYASYPNTGTQTLSLDVELGFSAQPVTNSVIEFGLGIPNNSITAPGDGVFIRVTSAGVQGIASNNGTELALLFPQADGAGSWAYEIGKKYQFIIYMGGVQAKFWVNDGDSTYLLGKINWPAGWGRICMSRGVQFFLKHRNTGVAGGAISALLGAYNVRLGGSAVTTTLGTQGNRIEGSYQGFVGGTLGTVARVGTISTGNETNPAAAVPATTSAALGAGLGGNFWETVSLAVNTDGIVSSYQVPAVSINSAGRRLVIRGVYLGSYVQTVIVGGPYTAEWFLAFGHTSQSLNTAEAAATKAPRRIPLPFIQQVTAAQAVNTTVAQNLNFVDFGDAPIFVNPGEFIQLCTRHLGTAGTSGTVVHKVTFIYGWE